MPRLKNRNKKDDISLASRDINLRSEQNKSLIELIANRKVSSENLDAVEEEVELLIFKFDRTLRAESRIPTAQQRSLGNKIDQNAYNHTSDCRVLLWDEVHHKG